MTPADRSGRPAGIGWELELALSCDDVRETDDVGLSEALAARWVDDELAAFLWLDGTGEQTIDVVRRAGPGAQPELLVSAGSDWDPPAPVHRLRDGVWWSGLQAGMTGDGVRPPVYFTSGLSDRRGPVVLPDGARVRVSRRPRDSRDGYFVGLVSGPSGASL